jgi:mannose-6-phosphate isomerase
MAIEHACVEVVNKTWGRTDLRPWSDFDASDGAVGELWFQRIAKNAPRSKLLLKLLFTNQPLSIQVHPGDAFARSIGLPNGKTEAWYILSATPEAQVAIGLKQHVTPQGLHGSIRDGSIAELVQWRPVSKSDVIFVPAGTIHSIGAGVVLAEIQQRSDATFRLFDYGRQRELHEDNAVAVSDAGPIQRQSSPRRLTVARTALIESQYFVLERIDLPANSRWALNADLETWLLVLGGHAWIGPTRASVGDAIFVEADHASIDVGTDGMIGLIAYPGPNLIVSLLQDLGEQTASAVDTFAQRSSKRAKPVEQRP